MDIGTIGVATTEDAEIRSYTFTSGNLGVLSNWGEFTITVKISHGGFLIGF